MNPIVLVVSLLLGGYSLGDRVKYRAICICNMITHVLLQVGYDFRCRYLNRGLSRGDSVISCYLVSRVYAVVMLTPQVLLNASFRMATYVINILGLMMQQPP